MSVAGLILLLLCCIATYSQAQEPELAPLNPAFVAWREERLARRALQEAGLRGESEATTRPSHTLGRIPSPLDRSHLEQATAPSLRTLNSELPTRFDLRDTGAVTSVKNQGDCGACWAFSTYGSIESRLLRETSQTLDFSENHMKNYHGFDYGPCEGGTEDFAIAYLARWAGPVAEADDPYHDYDDRPSPGGPCRKHLKSAVILNSATDMKEAIYERGAIHAPIVMRDYAPYYNAATYTYYYRGADELDHDVTVVGWDDAMTVTGAPSPGVWICKNSWGTSWGQDGYFYISYLDTKALEFAVTYEMVDTTTYLKSYQYDPLGHTQSMGYHAETAWGANVFMADEEGWLGAVGTYAATHNTTCEVRVYAQFDGASFSGERGQALVATLAHTGYHIIDLPEPLAIVKGETFAIVVRYTTPGTNKPLPLEARILEWSSKARANAGQSFGSSDGETFADVTAKYPDANICIKGLTVAPPAATAAAHWVLY